MHPLLPVLLANLLLLAHLWRTLRRQKRPTSRQESAQRPQVHLPPHTTGSPTRDRRWAVAAQASTGVPTPPSSQQARRITLRGRALRDSGSAGPQVVWTRGVSIAVPVASAHGLICQRQASSPSVVSTAGAT